MCKYNNIDDFIFSIKNRSFEEIILMANEEATKAERHCLKCGLVKKSEKDSIKEYATAIKHLICYMRYAIKIPSKFIVYDELKDIIRKSVKTSHA
ncbi:MAG: hypothetical protein HQK79_01620 [Desulfobacterales bacterium]|nr:hypothetical protein [Desulfobacterales bacterium]MBF0396407.1 hypothetical protein [Desulfobacterales bacterium]